MVPASQESGPGLAGSSASGSLLTRLQSRCWLGLQSSQGSTGPGSASKLTLVLAGRIQFLLALALCWLLA